MNPNLSGMQSPEVRAEIVALEIQLSDYKILLDESISNNEVFAKVKTIFHEMKIISEKIEELKKPK
ncbi:MAG TPA: hypothetical protein VK711_14795 [Puia sp.]|jgi:hypothetical protein|nr:hypothetical protein [Puia sp.]